MSAMYTLMMRYRVLLTLLLVTVMLASCGRTSSESSSAAASVALTPWDEPDLTGVWKLDKPAAEDPLNLAQLERLYTQTGQSRMKELAPKDDPVLNCGAPPFPRALNLGAPIQIIQTPGFMVVVTEAFPVYRIIPTNGRPHLSEDLRLPRNLGNSTARWEGDTLLVDVIAFSSDSWLAGRPDRPPNLLTDVWPVSDALHIVERWRRVDETTLEYQAHVEDQQMLSAAWDTPKVTLSRVDIDRVEEALCLVDDGPASYLERVLAKR